MKKHIVTKEYILFEKLKSKVFTTRDGRQIQRILSEDVYRNTTNPYLPIDTQYYHIRIYDKGRVNWIVGYIDYYGDIMTENRFNLDYKKFIELENRYQRIIKIENIIKNLKT